MYRSRISGAVQGKQPPLHLAVVAIEKGAFGLPLIMVGQLTYLFMQQNFKLNILQSRNTY